MAKPKLDFQAPGISYKMGYDLRQVGYKHLATKFAKFI